MPGLKDWLKKASSDLKLATKSIGDDETLDPAVYLAHQCAEKCLKAIFIFNKETVPKTHNLILLLNDCIKFNQEFGLLQKECKFLNPYSVASRYPNDSFRVNQKHLIKALTMANKIFDFVKGKISKQ